MNKPKTPKNKIVVIGDIHGSSEWKKAIENELDATREIFIGDYFDTFAKTSTEEQMANFNEIIKYKRDNPYRVVVLIGNHDFQYITNERYSGYQTHGASAIAEAVEDALSDGSLQAVYEEDCYLFSHAGVTKTWCRDWGIDPNNVVEEVNLMLEHNKEAFKYDRLDSSGTGESVTQSPIWVRPAGLKLDMIPVYKQVVGHTTQKHIEYAGGVIFIDALESREYLVIEDDKAYTGELEPMRIHGSSLHFVKG